VGGDIEAGSIFHFPKKQVLDTYIDAISKRRLLFNPHIPGPTKQCFKVRSKVFWKTNTYDAPLNVQTYIAAPIHLGDLFSNHVIFAWESVLLLDVYCSHRYTNDFTRRSPFINRGGQKIQPPRKMPDD
jgi:hypothetical protein